jgi:serine/threonine protein kinase HipA of HipAB toxin-antitoxin module
MENRAASGNRNQKYFTLRSELLDKNRRDSHSASRWTVHLLFLKGLTNHNEKLSPAHSAELIGGPACDRESHGVRRIWIYVNAT